MKARCIKEVFVDPHHFKVGEVYEFGLSEMETQVRRPDTDEWGQWQSHMIYSVTCEDYIVSPMMGRQQVKLSCFFFSRDYVDHFQPHQLCFDDYFQTMENK